MLNVVSSKLQALCVACTVISKIIEVVFHVSKFSRAFLWIILIALPHNLQGYLGSGICTVLCTSIET